MKVAVITGASGGIGREVARLLEEKAYRIYDISRTGSDDGKIVHLAGDVTNEESLAAAFATIAAREGKIDLLVCNAGMGIAGALEFTSLSDAKRQMDVNFFGVFLTAKYALPLLRAARGRMIAVSSAAALFPIHACTASAFSSRISASPARFGASSMKTP